MPIGEIKVAKDLFGRSLVDFAPEWEIEREHFSRVTGDDPNDYFWQGYSTPDHFGATVVRSATGKERVLGRRGPDPRGYPAIPGKALEAYRDGNPDLIISYLQAVGLKT